MLLYLILLEWAFGIGFMEPAEDELAIWALRLKAHIEIRESAKPPTLIRSTATRKVTERLFGGYDYDSAGLMIRLPDGSYKLKWESVERTWKMTQVAFEGGRLLTSLKPAAFARKTAIGLRIGGLYRLEPEVARKVLKGVKWR